MQLGYPYPKRVKLLEDLRKTTTGKTHGIRFQGKFAHMQIYSVPIELPKYRLKNGRTAAAQIEYLSTHPRIDRKIFSQDPELQEAQKIQHEILRGMVNEEGLFDYFKKHDQELPLILTNTGYIVNGNWPAPGSEDTELGVSMEPEVDHGEAEVHTRVQA
jgi:hypothetical protein